jgi:hypothetical protein
VKKFSSGYSEVSMSGRQKWLACDPVFCISSGFCPIYSVDILHYVIDVFSILAILCAVTGTAYVDIMSAHLLLTVDTSTIFQTVMIMGIGVLYTYLSSMR